MIINDVVHINQIFIHENNDLIKEIFIQVHTKATNIHKNDLNKEIFIQVLKKQQIFIKTT